MAGLCSCFSNPAVWLVSSIYAGEWTVYHLLCKPDLRWAVLFNVLLFLAFWSYLATALTDPGTPACEEWKVWSDLRAREGPEKRKDIDPNSGFSPGRASFCKKCQMERPERAHHCSQCGTCILRMDHHCPWIGSCVGWRNHKPFLLLNWWSFWSCVTFLLTLRRPNALESVSIVMEGSLASNMVSVMAVLFAFLFLMISGGMFVSSVNMVMGNITGIEELYHGENPYRLSVLENARQLLGPLDLRLLLPLPPGRKGSGVAFPIAKHGAAALEEGAALATSCQKYGST